MMNSKCLFPAAYLVFLLTLCLYTPLSAQEMLTLSGTVSGGDANHPLKSVIVSVRTMPDSNVVKRVATSAQGSFQVEIPAGRKYGVEFRAMSYERTFVPVSQQQGKVALGTIILKEAAISANEVEVMGWREFTQVLPDKRVYTIKDNPNIIANSVSEVLDQIPSVQVDENGAVKLRGDENVVIMVNDHVLKMDKEERNRYLQQLPAMNISSIEVRTTPGAKFDAKFNGGIINILTEKGLADYIGGNVYSNGNSIGRWGAGGTFYYNDSTITSSLGIGAFRMYNRTNTQYRRDAPAAPIERYLEKLLISEQDYDSYYANPQIDINLSPKDVLSFSASLNYNPGDFENKGSGSRHDINNQLLQLVYDTSSNKRNSSWMDYSLLYRHHYSEQSKLSIDLNFSQWGTTRDEYKSSIFFSPQVVLDSVRSMRQTIVGTERNPAFNFRADYSTAIFDEMTIEVGAKVEAERTPTEFNTQAFIFQRSVYETDTLQTLKTLPYYTMSGVYSNISYLLSKDLSLQVGMRYEYAIQGANFSGIDVRRDFSNIFPSASLSWTASPEYRFSASYTRNITVPWVGLLNPRVNRESSTSQFEGNPNVRPEFTHSIELNAMAFWGGTTLSLSPYLKRTVDDIRFSTRLSGDILHMTYVNFSGSTAMGFDGTISHRTRSGFSARLNFDVQRFSNNGSSITSDINSDVVYASCNGNISYQLLPSLSLSVGARYTSPYTNGGERLLSFATTNLNLVYKLMDNALTLTLTGADPLNIEQRTRINYGNNGFSLSADAKSITRFVSFNASYAFGKKNVNLEQHNKERTSTKGEG